MHKSVFSFVITVLMFSNTQAQNLWGAEAQVGQSEGQFSTDFIETGDNNNLSTTSWTALSISDSGGSTIPGLAYWKRNLDGYSQGAYWSEITPIDSPSQSDGVALFDSDFLDNNGTAGNFGLGTSPSPHRGELISPQIDLTGQTDQRIQVKFYSFYRSFSINTLGLAISTDDGVTWSDPIDYRSEQAGLVQGFVTFDLPASILAGVANLTAVRVKFIFDGDYYFAIIDDLTIMVSDLIYSSGFE